MEPIAIINRGRGLGCRQVEERIARGNPPAVQAKLAESHARLLARREELRRFREQREASGASDPG